MKLELIGHDDLYAVEQLQMSLFGTEVSRLDGFAISRLSRGEVWVTASATVCLDGRKTTARKRMRREAETTRLRRQLLQQSFYLAALPHLHSVPAWGALAGVRPTKLSTRCLLDGGTPQAAKALLEDTYFVTPERSALAVECSRSTVRAAERLQPGDVSLYVGIPFCPTRCAYCSFVSRTVGNHQALMEPYLQALARELSLTGKLLANSGRHVRSIYIGGGTPTTLDTRQMVWLLDSIRESFDLSRCLEFTVEGGRPDTLDPQKLCAIRAHGADRMSINPQTMQDGVLRACGRPHSREDILRSYRQAVDAGFTAINMDLIAGLPQDSYEGFCDSLEQVMALEPANITVHTLALKKGADLFQRREALPSQEEVAKMVQYANTRLSQAQYRPYYLYRQKYMSGSFENVGWSRDGLDCLYNIYMMEELHSIISLGGGGMNKVSLPDGTLRRFHNPKFPEQYISQIEDVLRQKQELFALM